MTRVLTSGWENRCRHPQMLGYHTNNVLGDQLFPSGGIEGLGYMRVTQEGASASQTEFECAVMYDLEDSDDEMYLNLDIYTQDAAGETELGALNNFEYRIYWSHSDDTEHTEYGYVWIDPVFDTCGWYWNGQTETYPYPAARNTWYTIDLFVNVNAGGASEVRLMIDGFEQFDDTANIGLTTYTTLNQVWLGGWVHWDFWQFGFDDALADIMKPCFDNLKVNNSQGAAPDNTYPWHLVLIGLPVDGDGAHTELTPQPSGPNWDNVDEVDPDDDDFNDTYYSGDIDTYTFTDTPTHVLGTPNWSPTRFILRNRHRVAVPAGEGFHPVVRIDGADYYGDLEPSGSAFACFEKIWGSRPDTGGIWERAVIDAMEAGAESGE